MRSFDFVPSAADPTDCDRCHFHIRKHTKGCPVKENPRFSPPVPCPACGLMKDGTGLLCAYCHRAARIQLDEDNQL